MLERVQKHQLTIEYRLTSQLSPRSNNPRTHSKKQIAQIAAAIRRFGFTNPILVDDGGSIIAGHGRLEAAKQSGLAEVPTVRLSEISEAEIRAYVIADNKLAENAGWDRELLGLELQYLSDLDIDLDVTITGFELPEIDLLIGELSAGNDDPADALVAVSASPPVTRPGDVWQIGGHRLICGDSTTAATYHALLGEERAQLVFTDPPYNVPISVMLAALARFSTANSPWPPARCPRPNSPRSCSRCSAISRPSQRTARSIFNVWTGAMSGKSSPPVRRPIRI